MKNRIALIFLLAFFGSTAAYGQADLDTAKINGPQSTSAPGESPTPPQSKDKISEKSDKKREIGLSKKETEQKDYKDCTTYTTWKKVESFLKKHPNPDKKHDVDQLAWDSICVKKGFAIDDLRKYLKVFGENADKKKDADKLIIKLEQDSTLKKCFTWQDYESALEKWDKDKDFIRRVDSACWQMCERGDDIMDYRHYLNVFDSCGHGEHTIEAKAKLNEQAEVSNRFWFLYVLIAIAVITVVSVLFALFYRRSKSSFSPSTHASFPEEKTAKIPEKQISNPEQEQPLAPETTIKPDNRQKKWVVVGASVKGNGHIQSNMPCQDNYRNELFGNGWGIAVVSDGAGSAAHSELGSRVVVERGLFHFKKLIEDEGWMKCNELPTDVEWLQKSYAILKDVRNEVGLVAAKNNVDVKSLSATCLVVVYSPIGLLAVHVGDGRMGYKSTSGEWHAMMTPHKGDEANQTIFLVSDFWSIPNYVMSGVLVPESIVVREPVKAFALMSDGCENTAWKCTILNPETGKYYDQNKPFDGFFNPLAKTMVAFQAEKVSEEERHKKWCKFLESGTKGFVKEQDDKTMIYGYFCEQEEIESYVDGENDIKKQ